MPTMNDFILLLLREMIVEKTLQMVRMKGMSKEAIILDKDPVEWGNAQYNALAVWLDLSSSFVKRLFEYGGNHLPNNISKKSADKILRFLGFNDFKQLEAMMLQRLKNTETTQSSNLHSILVGLENLELAIKTMKETLITVDHSTSD